jgi:hypothetical protein
MSDKDLAIHRTLAGLEGTHLVLGTSQKLHVILRLREFPGENNEAGRRSLQPVIVHFQAQTESRSAAN